MWFTRLYFLYIPFSDSFQEGALSFLRGYESPPVIEYSIHPIKFCSFSILLEYFCYYYLIKERGIWAKKYLHELAITFHDLSLY